MRRPELDHVLTTMLDSQPEVSDLLFTVSRPLQVEAYGELKPVTLDPALDRLTPYQSEAIALNLVGENQWHLQDLMRKGSCDTSFQLGERVLGLPGAGFPAPVRDPILVRHVAVLDLFDFCVGPRTTAAKLLDQILKGRAAVFRQ